MSSGKKHNRTSILLSFVSFGAIAYLTHSPEISLVVSLGTLSGIPLTPDLDVLPTVDNERIKKRAPMLWRWYWFPYADIIKHRAMISHFPVLSTIVRLLYISLPFIMDDSSSITTCLSENLKL